MSKSILIFGGGSLQLSIIRQVNKMGYQSVVIDPDPGAPGKELADLFYTVSADDFKRTLHIAQENKVIGIVTAATDKPVLMMAGIAEELKLPFPSFDSCIKVIDKARFKNFLLEKGISCAPGMEFDPSGDIPAHNYNFPLIIKPSISSGSRGVIRCDREQDLSAAVGKSLSESNSESLLLEEFIEGDEVSVEALVQNKEVHIIQITDKIVSAPPYNVELGHIQPSKYLYLKPLIQDLIQRICDGLGLNNCALHPEIKIKDDKLTVIELGPRLGGDYITSHLVPLSTGINIEEQAIRIAIGLAPEYDILPGTSMISYLCFTRGLRVSRSIDKQELKLKFPEIQDFRLNIKAGEAVPEITNSLNRYGYFILSGLKLPDLFLREREISNYIVKNIFNPLNTESC